MADAFGEGDIFAIFDNIDGKKEENRKSEVSESTPKDSGKLLIFQRGEKRGHVDDGDVEEPKEVEDGDAQLAQNMKKAKKVDDERYDW